MGESEALMMEAAAAAAIKFISYKAKAKT